MTNDLARAEKRIKDLEEAIRIFLAEHDWCHPDWKNQPGVKQLYTIIGFEDKDLT